MRVIMPDRERRVSWWLAALREQDAGYMESTGWFDIVRPITQIGKISEEWFRYSGDVDLNDVNAIYAVLVPNPNEGAATFNFSDELT